MPACAITGTFSSHSLLQLLDGIEQLVPAAELLAWLVQQKHLEIRFARLGDGLWGSAGHCDDDSPPRRGTIPGRSRSQGFLRESLLLILPIFPRDTLNLICKSTTQTSALPFVELFHAGPAVERLSDISSMEGVIASGSFACKKIEFHQFFFYCIDS